jgi:ankyrin repeat protein
MDNIGDYTLLMAVSKYGKQNIARIILEKKNEDYVNKQDRNGKNALMYAVENGHFHIVNILCEKKCSLDLRNNDDESVFQIAHREKYYKILLFLILEKLRT